MILLSQSNNRVIILVEKGGLIMKKIILRADDLGYSEGVNYGIVKSVKEGIIKSVGVMPNMPAVTHGLALLENDDVCLGQHTNICIGKPLTDPARIPSLVDEHGEFKSSKQYRSAKEDFVVLEEVILEIEAQYHRFVELTGRKPEYFEGHAVSSDNFFKGLEMVAEKYGLKYSGMSFGGDALTIGNTKVYIHMDSMKPEYDPYESLKTMVNQAHDHAVEMMICHPGYLDAYILKNSSLTIPRTQEVEMVCDPEIKQWLKDQDVQILSYRDL